MTLPIGDLQIAQALDTLRRYKNAKAPLERRLIQDEAWYKLRHWDFLDTSHQRAEPTSAWLFNSIMNKHADAMDNYPEPNVLPRELGDVADAEALSALLPVILEHNEFEQTYSNAWWDKLKHGTAAFGVFWDPLRENGLGDISIRDLDLLHLFWEPGITHLQQSRNLFIVNAVDRDLLLDQYPHLKDKLLSDPIPNPSSHPFDSSDKLLVVDWYYKISVNGRTLLHYAKLVGDSLLFSSENQGFHNGFYDHGNYPVVLDIMFPEEGTPVGFGLIAITKDPQMYIDRLDQNILENARMGSRPRFFAGSNTGINEQEFLDWNRPIVHVEGGLDESRLRQIDIRPLDSIYVTIRQMKIDELKETSANRDVSQGSTAGGVTAAAAIAALQEAGSKSSRDMIGASYRAYTKLSYLCIELVRQFYDEARAFRVTGLWGEEKFVSFSNRSIREQPLPPAFQGQQNQVRRPIFDIKIKAAKRSPFSRMSQNELAKELYAMGFFDPNKAEQALAALELMEFEGKDRVIQRVRKLQLEVLP